jgi:dTDP-4-amino-4,6-dideoxygalactose transaminase
MARGGIVKDDGLKNLANTLLGCAEIYGERAWAGEAEFIPGITPIPPSGKVIGGPELKAVMAAALDGVLTEGRWVERFEKGLSVYIGRRFASMCNSGSSANLLALTALMQPDAPEGLRLKPGDEVVTAAACFPTTVNPIIQNGLVPVFVDVELGTYVPTIQDLEAAIGPKTKGFMLAHSLGNPFPVAKLANLCDKGHMALIEDNCDSLGSKHRGKMTGTLGDLATQSFYPAHHITTGEGGMVLTSNPILRKIVESLRDWGRSCWCDPGKDNTCGNRFSTDLPRLPPGYDHKYTYSRIGYNLKSTDLQAAIGVAQLARLPAFAEARKANCEYLRRDLCDLEDAIIIPQATVDSKPNWFGFPITLRGLSRNLVVRYLEDKMVGTRLLFAGNILRQPGYADIKCRKAGPLKNTDIIVAKTFWVGVWPGITPAMAAFMVETIRQAIVVAKKSYRRRQQNAILDGAE